MTGLLSLWLPIVLSAVVVFIASSIVHMMSGWHKSDHKPVPNEAAVLDALRSFDIPPGDYMAPRCSSMEEMKSPEFKAKLDKGPVVMFTVFPKMTGMTSNLIQWFIYSLLVGVFSAYIGTHALSTGAQYLKVFQIVGTAAFMGYAVALWQLSIWYHRSWLTTFKSTVDGLIYALLTAGVFGWLWPR